MIKYHVQFFQDNIYEVYTTIIDERTGEESDGESVFQGNLSDCHAFIQLKKGGYM